MTIGALVSSTAASIGIAVGIVVVLAAAPAAADSHAPAVHIDVTGSRPLHLRGNALECELDPSDGALSFYRLNGRDYPRLGRRGSLLAISATQAIPGAYKARPAQVDLDVHGERLFGLAPRDGRMKFSNDRTRVTLDVRLRRPGQSKKTVARLRGTITCKHRNIVQH